MKLLTGPKPSRISAALTTFLMLATTLVVSQASEVQASSACSTTGATTDYAGGAGTPGEPYLLATAEQLALLSATSTDWTKHFKQTANISLAGGCIWSPIGSTSFTGTYDGGGFTVSGLKTTNHDGAKVGLIGELAASGIVRNVGVVDVDFVGKYHVGTLVGWSWGTIQNSFATGQVVGKVQTGGLVGTFSGVSISNSYARTSVSYNSVNPNPNNSGEPYRAGGLVGASLSPGTISFSWSSGVVSTPAAGVNYEIGGVFGSVSSGSSPTFNKVRWDTDVSTQSTNAAASGHIGTSTNDMLDLATWTADAFNIRSGWELFSASAPVKTWGICSQVNDGYPFLLWEYTTDVCYVAPPTPPSSGSSAPSMPMPTADVAAISLSSGPGNRSVVRIELTTTPSAFDSLFVVVRLLDFSGRLIEELRVPVIGNSSALEVPIDRNMGQFNVVALTSNAVGATPAVSLNPQTVKQPNIRKATETAPKRLTGKSLNRDVVFTADSAALSPQMKRTLRQAARLAKASDSRVAVTGFAAASPKGTKFEKRLAESRALRVANFLRKQGLENWIYFHGLNSRKGSDFPGQPRRVEIRVLK